MHKIITRVVGVSNRNPDGTSRQNILKKLARPGGTVILNHVSSVEGDPDTIEVLLPGEEGKKSHCVGFLPGRVGAKLARHLDAQHEVTAIICGIVSEKDPPHTALQVKITY